MNNHILTIIIITFSAVVFFFSLKLHLIEQEIKKIKNKKVIVKDGGIKEKIDDTNLKLCKRCFSLVLRKRKKCPGCGNKTFFKDPSF